MSWMVITDRPQCFWMAQFYTVTLFRAASRHDIQRRQHFSRGVQGQCKLKLYSIKSSLWKKKVEAAALCLNLAVAISLRWSFFIWKFLLTTLHGFTNFALKNKARSLKDKIDTSRKVKSPYVPTSCQTWPEDPQPYKASARVNPILTKWAFKEMIH